MGVSNSTALVLYLNSFAADKIPFPHLLPQEHSSNIVGIEGKAAI